MNCIICKKELPPEAKFCLECGARQVLSCVCGQVLPSDARFCLHCGTKVVETYPPIMQTPVMQTVMAPQPMQPMGGYQPIPQFMATYPMAQPTMRPMQVPVSGVPCDIYGNPVGAVNPMGQREMVAEVQIPTSGSRERVEEPTLPKVEDSTAVVEENPNVTQEAHREKMPENPEVVEAASVGSRASFEEEKLREKITNTPEVKKKPTDVLEKRTDFHVPVVGTGTHEPVEPPEGVSQGNREIQAESDFVEEERAYGAREIQEEKMQKQEVPVVRPPEPLLPTPQMVNTVVKEDEVIAPTTTSTVESFHTETEVQTVRPPEPPQKESKTVYTMMEMGYFGKDLYTDVSRRYGFYQGRIYFKREYELWSSTEEGNDIRLVIPNAGATILDFAVNSFGIFVWAHEFGVRKFTHTGEFIHTIDVPSHGMIENFAVHGDKVYVIALILVKPETIAPELRGSIKDRGEKSLRQRAYIMDFSVKKTRRFEWFPYEFCKVSMVTVGEEGFVAKVAYSHAEGSQVTNESGYYYFNTVQDTGICLSHSKVEPHRMMTGWEKYKLEIEELDYASIRGLQIPFIDLPNNRMWVYCTEDGKQWLEARTLETPELSQPIENVAHWILPENFSEFDFGYSYFDGIRMYHASHYSKFESILRDGSKRNMIEADNFGHGATWDFAVFHELIYIDLYARGLKQYVAGGQGLIELRRMEHPSTKQNVCFQES